MVGHYCFSGGLISIAAVNQSVASPLTWSWDKGSVEMTLGSHAQNNLHNVAIRRITAGSRWTSTKVPKVIHFILKGITQMRSSLNRTADPLSMLQLFSIQTLLLKTPSILPTCTTQKLNLLKRPLSAGTHVAK